MSDYTIPLSPPELDELIRLLEHAGVYCRDNAETGKRETFHQEWVAEAGKVQVWLDKLKAKRKYD